MHRTITLEGRLEIVLRDAEGRRRRTMCAPNTIVDRGVENILYLLTQNSTDPAPATIYIASLHVGTGDVAPTRADEALAHDVYAVDFGPSERLVYPALSEITFQHTLALADAVGYNLCEAGLVMAPAGTTGTLFARQVYAMFAKTAAMTATYIWTIRIATL